MTEQIYPATYLTKSNQKWLLIDINPEYFLSLKRKSIEIRDRSNQLWDFSIESDKNPDLSVYWFYAEYIICKLLGICSEKDFLNSLDPNKWLDWWQDIILSNGKVLQVKFTEWFFRWEHSWDLMNQYERKLTSDYYILVTKGDEYKKGTLRIVWWIDKGNYLIEDLSQTKHWYIKKKQQKINRCIIQSNLFLISTLEAELGIKFNLNWFKKLT